MLSLVELIKRYKGIEIMVYELFFSTNNIAKLCQPTLSLGWVKRLFGMCRWMGLVFMAGCQYLGLAFSIEFYRMGRAFSDFWGKTGRHIYG